MPDPTPARPDAAITRRNVLSAAVGVGASFAVPRVLRADPASAPAPALPTRPFGRTGRTVTVFGLGCFYVGAAADDDAGVAIVARALERGCTYFDTAPSYVRGLSERRVGIALAGRRDRVFLATKTLERDGTAARRELEQSLTRLKTDHVDLLQVHCVRDAAELDRILSDRGPLAAILRAKEEGLVRFVGVTGHRDPAVMKAALERWSWDSILMPLSPVDVHKQSFVDGTLPAAVTAGVARVAMKVFAAGRALAGPSALPAEDCLRFAYGLDISTAAVGCATPEEVDVAARVAAEAKPLDPERRRALLEAGKAVSAAGVEWWKG